jgi:non-canonical purine NTP pyrophosphatase (RdgB/HAM1 family)
MTKITFITGNQHKADYLAAYLGHPVSHVKVEIEELQSLDLKAVVRHKLLAAYKVIQAPVIVEDVALEFKALGRLPGTFIKSFMQEMPLKDICGLVDGKDRSVVARCMFGYYDGKTEQYFEGGMNGLVPVKPSGNAGFGWDSIFIPEGYSVPRAALSKEDDIKTYCIIKPFQKLKEFLGSRA